MSAQVFSDAAVKMKTADYIALEDKYGAHNYHPLGVVIARGKGSGSGMSKGKNTWISFRPIRR